MENYNAYAEMVSLDLMTNVLAGSIIEFESVGFLVALSKIVINSENIFFCSTGNVS